MAYVTADRVKDTSTSTSTGNFVVSGTAPSGFRTLSAVLSVNDTFYYAIQHQTLSEWEVGTGTYSSANTFARTTVLSSSNAGSAVSFSAGTKDVFLTLAATKSVQVTPSGVVQLPGVLLPGMQFYCLNTAFVGANSTATQSIFGLTNGVTVSGSTMYEFEMSATLLKTAGTTSHTFRTLFGGTATLNHILYDARVNCVPNVIGTYGGSSNQQGVTGNVATALATTGALTSANTYWTGVVKGVVSINAGGTFHPQYSLSAAPGGAYTTQVGSYFAIWPIGPSGSNVSVGTWS